MMEFTYKGFHCILNLMTRIKTSSVIWMRTKKVFMTLFQFLPLFCLMLHNALTAYLTRMEKFLKVRKKETNVSSIFSENIKNFSD